MNAKLPVTSGKPFDMETDWEREESRSFPAFKQTSKSFTFSHVQGLHKKRAHVSFGYWQSLVQFKQTFRPIPFVHVTIITGLLYCQDVKSVKHHQYTTTFPIITAHKHSGFESPHCFYLKTKADCFRNLLNVCVQWQWQTSWYTVVMFHMLNHYQKIIC